MTSFTTTNIYTFFLVGGWMGEKLFGIKRNGTGISKHEKLNSSFLVTFSKRIPNFVAGIGG